MYKRFANIFCIDFNINKKDFYICVKTFMSLKSSELNNLAIVSFFLHVSIKVLNGFLELISWLIEDQLLRANFV